MRGTELVGSSNGSSRWNHDGSVYGHPASRPRTPEGHTNSSGAVDGRPSTRLHPPLPPRTTTLTMPIYVLPAAEPHAFADVSFAINNAITNARRSLLLASYGRDVCSCWFCWQRPPPPPPPPRSSTATATRFPRETP